MLQNHQAKTPYIVVRVRWQKNIEKCIRYFTDPSQVLNFYEKCEARAENFIFSKIDQKDRKFGFKVDGRFIIIINR